LVSGPVSLSLPTAAGGGPKCEFGFLTSTVFAAPLTFVMGLLLEDRVIARKAGAHSARKRKFAKTLARLHFGGGLVGLLWPTLFMCTLLLFAVAISSSVGFRLDRIRCHGAMFVGGLARGYTLYT